MLAGVTSILGVVMTVGSVAVVLNWSRKKVWKVMAMEVRKAILDDAELNNLTEDIKNKITRGLAPKSF